VSVALLPCWAKSSDFFSVVKYILKNYLFVIQCLSRSIALNNNSLKLTGCKSREKNLKYKAWGNFSVPALFKEKRIDFVPIRF
jgi:hypothetical protein